MELNHRAPLTQAGDRIEPNLQLIQLQRRLIQPCRGNLRRAQCQTPGTQSAVGTQADGVTERFAKRMLQGLAQLLNDPLRCSIQ